MALIAEFIEHRALPSWSILVVVSVGVYLFYIIFSAVLSPSRSVPGPFLARLTRLWYVRRVRLGQFHDDNIALHRKYGKQRLLVPNKHMLSSISRPYC